jgi:hypothetical protein
VEVLENKYTLPLLGMPDIFFQETNPFLKSQFKYLIHMTEESEVKRLEYLDLNPPSDT